MLCITSCWDAGLNEFLPISAFIPFTSIQLLEMAIATKYGFLSYILLFFQSLGQMPLHSLLVNNCFLLNFLLRKVHLNRLSYLSIWLLRILQAFGPPLPSPEALPLPLPSSSSAQNRFCIPKADNKASHWNNLSNGFSTAVPAFPQRLCTWQIHCWSRYIHWKLSYITNINNKITNHCYFVLFVIPLAGCMGLPASFSWLQGRPFDDQPSASPHSSASPQLIGNTRRSPSRDQPSEAVGVVGKVCNPILEGKKVHNFKSAVWCAPRL